jgi:phage baseplate assembly protein gpV
MPDIFDRLLAMELKIEELQRRTEAAVRVGRITEVNPEHGLAKVDVGTPDNPLVTGWLPWTERAGAIKTWTPPEPGEQVRLVSPAGDMAQGWIDQGGFSNENPQPHDQGKERRFTVGDTTITETGEEITIETPKLTIKADVIIEGDFDAKDGHFQHEEVNVGEDHKHQDTATGPSLSGVPER